MKWEDCKEEMVKEVAPNKERAKSLSKMAERRLKFIQGKRSSKEVEFIVEGYYETIKELITALLSIKGYKSYSHECLVLFLAKFYKEFESDEIELIDQLRRIRNDIMYRGESVALDYLNRKEDKIKSLINKLSELAEEELEK
ncbi:MAG: hypothetical protein V1911_03080 [Candidatus Micrarchaeota archaeon]